MRRARQPARTEMKSSRRRGPQFVKHDDGTWIVLEDKQLRVFPNRGAALDCAREVAGDPDLPPLTQI